MNIDNYADSMSEMINKAIKKAFITGFQYAQSLNLTDDDFVDLGLPSGTKWSKEYLGVTDLTPQGDFFSYFEAKGYSLPTEEQLKELGSMCSMVSDKDYPHDVTIFGPNGNSIITKANDCFQNSNQQSSPISHVYHFSDQHSETQKHIGFWLYSMDDEPKLGLIKHSKKSNFNCQIEIVKAHPKHFKYQIRLVKCKNKM